MRIPTAEIVFGLTGHRHADAGRPWPVEKVALRSASTLAARDAEDGVDVLMDMGRTMTDVVGNCLASVVVAKWEGEFRETDSSSAPA